MEKGLFILLINGGENKSIYDVLYRMIVFDTYLMKMSEWIEYYRENHITLWFVILKIEIWMICV